jgi:hypothetical protein
MRNYFFFLVCDALLLEFDKILKDNLHLYYKNGVGPQFWLSSKGIETRALFESVSFRLTYCQDALPILTLALLKPQET